MKEIILKIPDSKVDFVMELVKHLGLEVTPESEIPEEHKTIVRERIQKSKKHPERLLDWKQIEDTFKLD